METLCGVVIWGDETSSAILVDPCGSGTTEGLVVGLEYISITGDVDTDISVRLSFVFCLVVWTAISRQMRRSTSGIGPAQTMNKRHWIRRGLIYSKVDSQISRATVFKVCPFPM